MPDRQVVVVENSIPQSGEVLNTPPCPISHNWPLAEFAVQIYSGISMIKRAEVQKGGHGGGIRSVVSNFSRPSRKRLLEKMARCRNMDTGYFATFTYPGDFTYDWRQCKEHLFRFRKRILRAHPQARVIWRMEIKPRQSGASEGEYVPHYHMLIFGLPYGHENDFYEQFATMWNEIANNKLEDNAFLRSDVSQIRSRKQAVFYASKYAAKIDNGNDDGFGRHWGFFGQWDESMSSSHILSQQEVIQLKRLIRSWAKSKGKPFLAKLFSSIRQDFGLSVFGLGDHDDQTYASCTMSDLITCAQRLNRYTVN